MCAVRDSTASMTETLKTANSSFQRNRTRAQNVNEIGAFIAENASGAAQRLPEQPPSAMSKRPRGEAGSRRGSAHEFRHGLEPAVERELRHRAIRQAASVLDVETSGG